MTWPFLPITADLSSLKEDKTSDLPETVKPEEGALE